MAPVFFIHVMKTGGTSLVNALGRSQAFPRSFPTRSRGDIAAKVDPGALLGSAERFDLVSVHMPAWVAERHCPNGTHVTVLREPVARTISHLHQLASLWSRQFGVDRSVEDLYDDRRCGRLLANYQLKLFAADPGWRMGVREMASYLRPSEHTDRGKAERILFNIAIAHGTPRRVTESDLANAIRRLEALALVGVTEDLGGMTSRLAELTGVDLGDPERWNTSGGVDAPAPGLNQRIAADCALEMVLYRRACELAGHDLAIGH